MNIHSLAAAAVALAFSNAALALSDYQLVAVTPPGALAQAWDVNNDGTVVGCLDASGEWRAFAWKSGALRDLGAGCATAINEGGLIGGHTPSGDLQVWNGSTVTPLGVNGDITGINARGTVTGWYKDAAGATHGFTWINGRLATLPDAPGATATFANGINAQGEVIFTGAGRGFVSRNGQVREIAGIGGAGTATPNAINNEGTVVGMGSDHGPAAFINTHGTTQRIPNTPSFSSAVAINNAGQVLGDAEGSHGYLVDTDGSVTNLSAFPAVQAAGWSKMEPAAINDNGWIVGSGRSPASDQQAFVLVPVKTNNAGNSNGKGGKRRLLASGG